VRFKKRDALYKGKVFDMAQKCRSRKTIPLKVGNDSTHWRFASVQEALTSGGVELLAGLIRSGDVLCNSPDETYLDMEGEFSTAGKTV
jgi:hypothetical protein